jgi:hypothetical protein
MKPKASRAVFVKFAEANGVELSNCTPRIGFSEMFRFYESVVPAGCSGNDADMLLYQWGTYDWGLGEHFELHLTRQFIEDAKQDDDAISQLSVTFKFKPTTELRALGASNLWCHSTTELQSFREFVEKSGPFLATADSTADATEVDFSYM